MMATAPDVERLSAGCVDVTPQDRDWSEGYPDQWDYVEAPCCPACGDYCRHIAGDELADANAEDEDSPVWSREFASEHWDDWRCVTAACERFGDVIDPHDAGAEGPMMNYAYPLRDGLNGHGTYEAANLIRDLPLCLIYWEDDRGYELALTGGGMDLSWEICEAFIRLGYLPPLHFCDLPRMAGMDLTTERNARIIAACRRTCEITMQRAQRRLDDLERLAG